MRRFSLPLLTAILFISLRVFSAELSSPVTVYGPEKMTMGLGTKTIERSFNLSQPQATGILFLTNGDGSNLNKKECKTIKEKIVCLITQIKESLDRPQKVEITLNGKVILSQQAYNRDQGQIPLTVNLLAKNQLSVRLIGVPFSDVTVEVKANLAFQNLPPVAQFSFTPTTGIAPEIITFNGLLSADPDGTVTSYEWDFGTGEFATGALVLHNFQTAGTYAVKLKVTDNLGATNTKTQNITIKANQLPVANFTVQTDTSLGIYKASFDASSSTDADGNILEYSWEFEPGQIGTGVQTEHIYQAGGTYTVKLTVKDNKQGVSTSSQVITLTDTAAPNLSNIQPLNGQEFTKAAFTTSGSSNEKLSKVTLSLNGAEAVEATLSADKMSFQDSLIALSRGTQTLKIEAFDLAGNKSSVTVTFKVNINQAPIAHIENLGKTEGPAPLMVWLSAKNSTDPDADAITYQWDFDDGTTSDLMQPTHEFSQAGTYDVVLTVKDSFGAVSEKSIQIKALETPLPVLPPAPELEPELPSTLSQKYEFLFTGPQALQTNVQVDQMDGERLTHLHGMVLGSDMQPLPGVTVTLLNHGEQGQTLTRADGKWDLVVNGGGLLVVQFKKSGYSLSQRKVATENLIPVQLDTVVMVKRDPAVTIAKMNSNLGVMHAASEQVDADGSRVSRIFIPPQTTAQIVMPDGSKKTVDQLSLRATEFTVGPNGANRMPATLPPRTAYTYAADFSADEVAALGGEQILFSKPVPIYVDNFLNFPAGSAVPAGYFNPKNGHWEALNDAIVIRSLGKDEQGRAILDLGSGVAPETELARHGITDSERMTLGSTYASGSLFWRAQVEHFSSIDLNGNFAQNRTPSNIQNPQTDEDEEDPCAKGQGQKKACILTIPRRMLQESIALPGTGLSLEYSTERAPGRIAAGSLELMVITQDLISDVYIPMRSASAKVEVEGQVYQENYPTVTAGQMFRYSWNGYDSFGRKMYESAKARVTIQYIYPGGWAIEPFGWDTPQTWDNFGSQVSFTVTSRGAFIVERKFEVNLTSPFDQYRMRAAKQLGGWNLDIHHSYDPKNKRIYLGNGNTEGAGMIPMVVSTFAGTGVRASTGDGGPAKNAGIITPREITQDAQGNYYFTEQEGAKIRKIDRNGIISTIAGTGVTGSTGDGGLAINAQLNLPIGLKVAEDGTIYFSEYGAHVIRKITPDGIIHRVAGTRVAGYSGDGGPALDATFNSPRSLVLGTDGGIYVTDEQNHVIRRIQPDGKITTFAGTGVRGFSGDGGDAINAQFNTPNYTVMDSSGNLYVADSLNHRVRKISQTGYIETIAGTGFQSSSPDGLPALETNFSLPSDIAITPSGELIVTERFGNRVRMIGGNGITHVMVGTGEAGYNGDGRVGPETTLNQPRAVYVERDGSFLITDYLNHRIRKVSSALPGKLIGTTYIPASDSSEAYGFDSIGRHVETLYGETLKSKYKFSYDQTGLLSSVTDAFGKTVQIQRNSNGRPSAIVSHYGQAFTLELDGNGYLSKVTAPTGDSHQMQYDPRGLMTSFAKPEGNTTTMTYDAQGYLDLETLPNGGFHKLIGQSNGKTILQEPSNETTVFDSFERNDGIAELNIHYPDGSETKNIKFPTGTETRYSDGSVGFRGFRSDRRYPGYSKFWGFSELKYTEGKSTTFEDRSYTFGTNLAVFKRTTNWNKDNWLIGQTIYDSATKVTSTVTSVGRKSQSQINDFEQTVTAQEANFLPVQFGYDSLGRLSTIQQGDRETLMTYDQNGFVSSVRDPAGRLTSFQTDAVGRVLKTIRPDSKLISYQYDRNSNLTGFMPPDRMLHSMFFNLLDYMSEFQSPSATKLSFQYDLNRGLKSFTRGDGRQIQYSYGTAVPATGKLVSAVAPDFQIDYQYSPATKLLSRVQSSDNVTIDLTTTGNLIKSKAYSGLFTANVTNEFYANGMLPSAETVSGQRLTISYDSDQLPIQFGSLVLQRDALSGLVTKKTLGNFSEEIQYSEFGEVKAKTIRNGTALVYQETYTRDRLGRITTRIQAEPASTKTWGYEYDEVGRLKRVSIDGSVIREYAYDGNGNRTQVVEASGTVSATFDAQDRMLDQGQVVYGYNDHGDRILKNNGGTGIISNYVYTSLGQLRSVTSSLGQVSYQFDGDNRRVARLINGNIQSYYVYDSLGRLVAELGQNSALRSRFVYLTQEHSPDYMVRSGRNYYFIKDQLGSILKVIDTATGNVTQELQYDEFGKRLVDTNISFQPFGYAGGLFDGNTGLVRFGARDYDPETGRWMSKDPILLDGKQTNFYEYSYGDPVNFIDPSGKYGILVCIKIRIQALAEAYYSRSMSSDPCKLNDSSPPFMRDGEYLNFLTRATLECVGAPGFENQLLPEGYPGI